MTDNQTTPTTSKANEPEEPQNCKPACPVCGGSLIEIRAKLQCSRCHRICETCCEGGLG
jgi:hypothetical protein